MEGRKKTQIATTPRHKPSQVCQYIEFQHTHYKKVTVYFDPDAFSLLDLEDRETFIKKIANALAYTKSRSSTDIQFYVTKVGLSGENTYHVVSINKENDKVETLSTCDIDLNATEAIRHAVLKEAELSSILDLPESFKREDDSAAVNFKVSRELGASLQAAHDKAKTFIRPTLPKKWSERNYNKEAAEAEFPELAAIFNILEYRENESDEQEQALLLEIEYAEKIQQLLNDKPGHASTSTTKTEGWSSGPISDPIEARKRQLEEQYQALRLEFDQTDTNDELKKYIQQEYHVRLEKLHADLAFIQARKETVKTFLSLPEFAKEESPVNAFVNQKAGLVYAKKLLAYALQQATNQYFTYAKKMGADKQEKFKACFRNIATIQDGELVYIKNLPKAFATASLKEIEDFISQILQDCSSSPTGSEFLFNELKAVHPNSHFVVIGGQPFFTSTLLEIEKTVDSTGAGSIHAQVEKTIGDECRKVLEATNRGADIVAAHVFTHEILSANIALQRRFIKHRNTLAELKRELDGINNRLKTFSSHSSELSLTSSASGDVSLSYYEKETDFQDEENEQKEKILLHMEEEIERVSKQLEDAQYRLRNAEERARQEVKQKAEKVELAQCVVKLKEHIASVLERFPEKPEWESVIRHDRYWKIDHNWAGYQLKIATLKSYAEKADTYSFEEVREISHAVVKLEKELQADLDVFKMHLVSPKSSQTNKQPTLLPNSKKAKGKTIASEGEEEDRDSENEQGPTTPLSNSTVGIAPTPLPERKTIIGKTVGVIVGGGLGAILGAGLGALAGFFLAPITFGASVPVGAAIGAVAGGGAGGLVGGGIIGLGIGHLIDKWWQRWSRQAASATSIDNETDAHKEQDYYPPARSSVILSNSAGTNLASSTHAFVGKTCRDNPGKATGQSDRGPSPSVDPIVKSDASYVDLSDDFEEVMKGMYDAADDLCPTNKLRS